MSSLLPGLDPSTLAYTACLRVDFRLFCSSLSQDCLRLLWPADEVTSPQSKHRHCLASSSSTGLEVVSACRRFTKVPTMAVHWRASFTQPDYGTGPSKAKYDHDMMQQHLR